MTTAETFDLSGRTALITGGGTGLGQRFAQVLAGAGASVVLGARRADKLQETAARIEAAGGQARCVPMDVTDAAQISAAFDVAETLGPVSILVNNAGVAAQSMLLDLDESEWDTVLDTNLKGAWLVAREAAHRMINAGASGSIVNIASMLGSVVQKGTGPYAASKAALIQITRVMALEWAKFNIRVNALAPGYFLTEMSEDFLASEIAQNMIKRIPQRRLGHVEQLDGALLLLASDASEYMTGVTITVDGGHSLTGI